MPRVIFRVPHDLYNAGEGAEFASARATALVSSGVADWHPDDAPPDGLAATLLDDQEPVAFSEENEVKPEPDGQLLLPPPDEDTPAPPHDGEEPLPLHDGNPVPVSADHPPADDQPPHDGAPPAA